MSLPGIVGQAFLDGFTMAGFSRRLRQPGSATVVFEDEAEPGETSSVVIEVIQEAQGKLSVKWKPRDLPADLLHSVVEELLREERRRVTVGKAAHGAT